MKVAISQEEYEKLVKCKQALATVMGDIDFTRGACRRTEMVGACLNKKTLDLAHEALAEPVKFQFIDQ